MIPMADKDTVTKDYMSDNATFADLFNFYIYDGHEVIVPEQLKPLDTTEIALPYSNEHLMAIQKLRDVMKLYAAMSDDKATYLLLGVENQSELHYAMPIKNGLYDMIEYTKQVEFTAREHRKNKDKPETNAEFLSGFYQTDRLHPVITLVVYFGADEWNAPKSIHEMLYTNDEVILRFVPDYKINLVAPAEIDDEHFEQFHTELRELLKFIKYSKDKEKLDDVIHSDDTFKHISRKTADVINIVTGSELHYETGKDEVDMCKAIEDMRNDSIAIGETKGILSTLLSLVKDGILTVADAAKRANMTVAEFEEKTGLKA